MVVGLPHAAAAGDRRSMQTIPLTGQALKFLCLKGKMLNVQAKDPAKSRVWYV